MTGTQQKSNWITHVKVGLHHFNHAATSTLLPKLMEEECKL